MVPAWTPPPVAVCACHPPPLSFGLVPSTCVSIFQPVAYPAEPQHCPDFLGPCFTPPLAHQHTLCPKACPSLTSMWVTYLPCPSHPASPALFVFPLRPLPPLADAGALLEAQAAAGGIPSIGGSTQAADGGRLTQPPHFQVPLSFYCHGVHLVPSRSRPRRAAQRQAMAPPSPGACSNHSSEAGSDARAHCGT